MPTVAYVVQAFADDMTLLLFLPTPLVHACCNCKDWIILTKKTPTKTAAYVAYSNNFATHLLTTPYDS